MLDTAIRLRETRRRYDRLIERSTVETLVDQLAAGGVNLFEPSDDANPTRLRGTVGTFLRLASEAREAAAGRR